MKRSSGIKRLVYEALRRLDNLRYRARRLSLLQGVATRHDGYSYNNFIVTNKFVTTWRVFIVSGRRSATWKLLDWEADL